MVKKPVEMEASVPNPETEGAAFTDTSSFFAWAKGVQQITRSVPIYQRLDLLGVRDNLGIELEDARAREDAVEASRLLGEIQELTDQIIETRMTVVLQGVTQSRFREIEAEAKREHRDENDRLLYRIAAQIVEPTDMDFEALKMLDDILPLESTKIGTAWAQIVNASPDVLATAPK